jgi:hypothetical protein
MPLIVVEVAQRFCQRLHVRFAIAATDLWPNPFGPGAYTPIVTKHAAAASSLLCFTIINDPSFRLADWQTGRLASANAITPLLVHLVRG